MRPDVGQATALPGQQQLELGGVLGERGVRHGHIQDVRGRGGEGQAKGHSGKEEVQGANEEQEKVLAEAEESEERNVRESEEQRCWEKGYFCIVKFK